MLPIQRPKQEQRQKTRFLRVYDTVAVAQLVRASDCDSEGRGFESH